MNFESLFTYATGIATILGFILQIKDYFPAHREVRKTIVLLVAGIFIGSIIGSFQNLTISTNFSLDGYKILIGLFVIVLLFILIVAIFSKQPDKRDELYGILSIATIVFIFVLIFGYLVNYMGPEKRNEITIEELLLISNSNKEKGNYERSIYFLEQIKTKLNHNDPRYKSIQDKIENTKKKQLGN